MSATSRVAHDRKFAALRGAVTTLTAMAIAVCAACADGGGPTPAAAPQPPATHTAENPAPTPAPTPAPENNPVGDIPDNQVYIPYTAPDRSFTVAVPEGWARTTEGQTTIFTDKLNSVRIESGPRPNPPDPTSVEANEIPTLRTSVPGFQAGKITTVRRKAGTAVMLSYEAIAPADPVTGKNITDAVERYEYWNAGQQVTLTLSGPKGADNVDPWRLVTDSLRWST